MTNSSSKKKYPFVLMFIFLLWFFTEMVLSARTIIDNDTKSKYNGDEAVVEDWEKNAGISGEEEDKLLLSGSFSVDFNHPFDNNNHQLDPFNLLIDNPENRYRSLLKLSLQYYPFDNRSFYFYGNNYSALSAYENEFFSELDHHNFDNVLTEFYAVYKGSLFGFILGKKNFIEGTGYFVNPTDHLGTPTSIAGSNQDRKKRAATREGDLLGAFDIVWEDVTLRVSYIPEIPENDYVDLYTNENHAVQGKLSFLFLDTDINIIVYQAIEQPECGDITDSGFPGFQSENVTNMGFSLARVFGKALELHTEMSYRYDRTLPWVKKNILPAGPVTYNYYTWEESSPDHRIKLLLGGQYTFSQESVMPGWNIILEYFFQNEGWSDDKWNTYFESLDDANNYPPGHMIFDLYNQFGSRNLQLLKSWDNFWSKHYLFVRIAKSNIFNLFDFSIYNLWAMQDVSFMTGMEISKTVFDSFKFSINADMNYGSKKSEFGRLPTFGSIQAEIKYLF